MSDLTNHNADIDKKVSISSCGQENDLISRQMAIDAIIDELMPSTPLSVVIRAKNRFKDLPSVQQEPHEGYWIGGDGSCICSECNGSPMDFIGTMGASFDAYVEIPMNYCPNCEARMKGDPNETD